MKKFCIIIISVFTGVIIGGIIVNKKNNKKLNELSTESKKFNALYLLMIQWMRAKQLDNNLSNYLEQEGYHNVAIYGMSSLGERIVKELENTNINISYGIDINAKSIYSKMKIYEPNDKLPKVDAILVTSILYYEEIKNKLKDNVECQIISLEDIFYQL